MNPRAFAALALLGAAALALYAYANKGEDGGYEWTPLAGLDDISQSIEDLNDEVWNMPTSPAMNAQANVRAFLETIKRCEGTAGQSDPYRVCYGYSHVIQNMADHPAVTGEWTGKRLTDQQCAGAKLGPGCVSTAAGAYQLIKPTWLSAKARLGLTDFGPAAQDAAAALLLRDCGAYSRLAAGDLQGAVTSACRTWASLPGAGYAGQGTRSMAQVQAWYVGAGGSLA